MKSRIDILVVSITIIFLSACGGGEGSNAPLVAGSAPALATSDNSYRNFKQIGLTPQVLPAFGDARAYANFSGSGRTDIFIARMWYSLSTETPQTATPSQFSFWVQQLDGTYIEDTMMLSSYNGCIHPRKPIVADFNKDGRPDVFVACHGWDASPFPGEKNKIILSQPGGTYVINDASPDVGFFHSASAADLNGDGYPDVVLVNNFDSKRALVLLNKGDGTFVRESGTRLPTSLVGNYFSIELLDINEDGVLDLILGGHEWEGAPTKVFLNPGNNIFEGVTPIAIPAVQNEGVVLDFVATGTGVGRVLWVLRTSGGDGTFYQSRVIQKVTLSSLTSTLALYQRPGSWVPWIIPTIIGGQNVITTDNASDAVSLAQ